MSRARQLQDELGYSKDQGESLRDLFNTIDLDLSGTVDITELTALFTGLVEMDTYAEQELDAFIQKFSDTRNPDEIDFAGFLRLLKYLETKNWHNIVAISTSKVNDGSVVRRS